MIEMFVSIHVLKVLLQNIIKCQLFIRDKHDSNTSTLQAYKHPDSCLFLKRRNLIH